MPTGIDPQLSSEQCNAKGNQALTAQDFQTAALFYTAGLERDEKKELHPVLLSNRSSAYAHSGQWGLSLEDADSCVKLRPTWPRGHACRGAALEGMNMLQEALAAFTSAQDLSPSNQELAEIIADIQDTLKVNTLKVKDPLNLPATSSAEKTRIEMPATNQTIDSIHLDRSSISALGTNAHEEKVAGVGMHIMLDENYNPPRIKILNIAEWSPLESHVLPGDTLEAIDRIPCNTLTFEQASGMIVGRPGDTITLQFSRPGSSKPTPWRITLPRVLPRHTVRVSKTDKVSAPVQAPISKMLDGAGTSPMFIRGPEVGVRVVITSNEIWNTRYGDQHQIETDFKRLIIDDVAKAAGVSSMRLNIYRMETDSPGLRVHMAIHTSPAAGSGIQGIDPASSKEVALNLISQGADARSKLRSIRPAIVKVEFEGEISIQAAPVQASTATDTDLMRNFMTELETLTFFIQANHDDNLLYHYSRVGDKVKPPDVLKPYEAADRLKRAYLQVQKELEEFKRIHHMPYEELNRVVKERDRMAEERHNLYHEVKLLRAEVGELRPMRELFDVEKAELLERYEMEKKLIREYMKIEDKSLEQATATVEHQQKYIQTLQDYTQAAHRQGQEVNTGTMPSMSPLPPVDWDEARFISKLQAYFAGKVSPSTRPNHGVPNYGTSTYTSTSPPQSNTVHHYTSTQQKTDRAVESSATPLPEHDQTGDPIDERPLPPGWSLEEHDGQRLYVDHNNRRFSYVHPLELPGSEERQGPIVNSRPGTASVPSSSLQHTRRDE